MQSNEMLLKCMKCENNIECWGIKRENRQHDTDPTDIKISVDAVCKNLKRLDPKNINDFMAYAILMYVRTTINDVEKGTENQILHTSMCLLEGLTGSTKLTWDCPDAFEYTPVDDTIKCEYNYHDPVHPDVCHFECMLDANLEFNDRLTPKAQEYRDKLIVGVERMMKKVEDYKNTQ